MFLFYFFLLAWFGSAVSSSIYNMALKDSEPTHVAEQLRKRQTTTTIQFFKSFEMLHLHLKKKKQHFFNNFNNDTQIHMEMGKMVCFDRN